MTFSWRKLGRVFDPSIVKGRPWLNEFAQAPSSLILDDVVRMFFSCRPPPDQAGQYVSYSAYVDLDRRDLTKIVRIADRPILELGGKGTFDEFGTYPVSVARSGSDVIALYAGWTRCDSVPFNVAIGCAFSDDLGVSFRKCGRGPVLPYTPNEPFVMSGPKLRRFGGKWHLFYIAGTKWKPVDGRPEPVYKIRHAISDNCLEWAKTDTDLVASRIEHDEAQASPDVFFANGVYHMFFCYRYSAFYRGHSGGYRIGYATSADLLTWVRKDERVGIDVSSDGWDSEMISYPHVFEVEGRVYMAYLGNQVGRHGFGIAQLEGELQ